MSQPDLETTKRFYRSFLEWAQICSPIRYMAIISRRASKDEILGLVRDWAEAITKKNP